MEREGHGVMEVPWRSLVHISVYSVTATSHFSAQFFNFSFTFPYFYLGSNHIALTAATTE
jgi:hypothetical protein